MKIEKLIIYGFGKHENVTINLGPGMNVLYGLNEAGKTTIQQFILHVLFGFPQRNSTMLRYEPKSGGKYGGQVQIMDETYGKCTIERVGGKSAGDVTVYFEDGKQGGEEELILLLRHYDRTSFEAIFSFSLLQLQGFEKMDEEELSRTLLASGTTGVDVLLQLEKQMEKEMVELFRKSGRNPEMNVKMKELRDLELELKGEQEKVAEYAPSIERIHEIDELLRELRKEEEECQEQLRHFSHLRQLRPLYQKKEELEKHLRLLGPSHFPSNGLRRYESLSGKLTETEATKIRIENELSDMAARLPEREQTERIVDIELLLARESEWHEWRSALVALEDDLHRLKSLKRRHLNRLGLKGEQVEAVLFQADVSIRKEEEMHELLGEMNKLNHEIDFVNAQFKLAENKLAKARENLAVMESPSIEEMERAREWPHMHQQLAEAKAYVSLRGVGAKRESSVLSIALFLLALAFIGFGFIQQQWFVVIAGVFFGVIGAFLYPKKESGNDSKFGEMEQFVSRYEEREHEMAQLVARVEAYKRNKEKVEEVIITLERDVEMIKRELDILHGRRRQTETVFDAFIIRYGFDGLPSPGIVPELFRIIRDVQEVARNIEEATERKKRIEADIDRRTKEAEKALQQVATSEMIYELLRREYIRLNEEAESMKSLKASIERLTPTLKETVVLVNSHKDNLHALLDEAGAETEEEFYTMYDVHQESISLKEQLANIEMQLTMDESLQLLETMTNHELSRKVNATEAKLSSIEDRFTDLVNEKATLVNKTERLLTDETYGDKLQLFEMKKAELAQLAKKWSARKAVADAIGRTMLQLREEKLPEVLEQAERIFKELTGGKYEGLTITEEGYFIAVSSNGMRYPIIELSQATKEQAYIALRLSLAASVIESAAFPIIMDDPFVHFDEPRLSRMIDLLGISKKHQFIYFTCHKKMTEKWTNATVINVSEIGSEQGAFIL